MCASMVDIQSATAEIRRGKKEEERKKKKPQGKNIMACPIDLQNAREGSHYTLHLCWGFSTGVIERKKRTSSFTAHRNARIASAVLATAIPSVCLSARLSVRLSVTRRYCVKTATRSTVQFALSDSKMCLVL